MLCHQVEYVRLNWRQLLPILLSPAKKPVNGEMSFICPFCSHGAHGDGLTFDPNVAGRLHCFGPCGWSGDVIDLYQALRGCSFKEAISDLSALLGTKNHTAGEKLEINDTTQFILHARKEFVNSPAEVYLQRRGISTEVATKYGVGYCGSWRHPKVSLSVPATPRLIIPTSTQSYLARDIRPTTNLTEAEKKYSKQKVGSAHIFGLSDIFRAETPIFIVEGELDALSLMEVGRAAIALGSVSCCTLFLKEIAQQEKPKQPFIVALDNDAAGIKAEARLLESLNGQGIVAINGQSILGSYKDANEALIADRKLFEERVQEAEITAKRKYHECNDPADSIYGQRSLIVSTKVYLQNDYEKDVKKFSSFNERRSGFWNLDSQTILYPGLYALGGISSLGKTTFAHQLAEQLAVTGEHVLYFPIEQTTMELVSKGISRTMYQSDPDTAISSIRLRSGFMDEAVKQAQAKYTEQTETLYIAECSFSTTAIEIGNLVHSHAEKFSVSPIVVVDYLQALQVPDSRMAPRESIDYSLRILKDLQTELSATIIIVSSLNRGNYLMPIGFESFKESGGIEYTCDVVWGIDLLCMDDPIFDTQGQIKQKRELINKAKVANPREVRLMCLKNRYGVSSYSAAFEYYPAYDTFVPISSDSLEKCSHSRMDSSLKKNDELVLSSEEREAIIKMFLE